MKLIVGLGNPGEDYALSRHNVGLRALDFLAADLGLSQNWKKGENYLFLISKERGQEFILSKSQSYMNVSGRTVSDLIRRYRIDSGSLLVVHDDLDLPLGSFKLQLGRGPHGHGGLNSLSEFEINLNYWRLRIGIDNRSKEREKRTPGKDYVLTNFTEEEEKVLEGVLKDGVVVAVKNWLLKKL